MPQAMQTVELYAISFGGVFGLFLIWKLVRFIDRHTPTFNFHILRKWLLYACIGRRAEAGVDMSAMEFLLLLLFLAGNTVSLLLHIRNIQDIAVRASWLFLINAFPIVTIGRANFISDFAQTKLNTIRLMHHWLGRMSLTHGIIHGIIRLSTSSLRKPVDIYLLTTTTTLLFSSIIWARRLNYDLFKILHIIQFGALVGGLWWYVPKRGIPLIVLAVFSAVSCMDIISWTLKLYLTNSGFSGFAIDEICRFGPTPNSTKAIRLSFRVDEHHPIKPGQYYFIAKPWKRFGFLQRHPYTVAWTDVSKNGGPRIHFLIECQNGFSRKIQLARPKIDTVLLDGPYGGHTQLQDYDKVLFVAKGIGLVSQLLSIRQLLKDHDDQKARVRRITLFWELDANYQFEMFLCYLKALLKKDKERKFQILHVCCFPPKIGSPAISNIPDLPENLVLCNSPFTLNVEFHIGDEFTKDAGNMAVILTGGSSFEQKIRSTIISNPHDIDLLTGDFKPAVFSQNSTEKYNENIELANVTEKYREHGESVNVTEHWRNAESINF